MVDKVRISIVVKQIAMTMGFGADRECDVDARSFRNSKIGNRNMLS